MFIEDNHGSAICLQLIYIKLSEAINCPIEQIQSTFLQSGLTAAPGIRNKKDCVIAKLCRNRIRLCYLEDRLATNSSGLISIKNIGNIDIKIFAKKSKYQSTESKERRVNISDPLVASPNPSNAACQTHTQKHTFKQYFPSC